MINLPAVVANALWVLGLSLALTALSWAHYTASQHQTRLRRELDHPAPRTALDAGLLLFCAGLAATSTRWWERALWLALALAWALLALAWAAQIAVTTSQSRGKQNQ
jgi:hypothetical protein